MKSFQDYKNIEIKIISEDIPCGIRVIEIYHPKFQIYN